VPWPSRLRLLLRCSAAGMCLAASVPPWGWWPLAFVGIAIWDRLVADVGWALRFRRSWLVAAVWLFPALLWMWDLTKPGYVIAAAAYAGFFAVAVALVPPHAPARWVGLPAAIVLAEIARWTIPFGGVPLATLAMSQADAPLAQTARIGTAIVVSGLVAVGGVVLSAVVTQRWRAAGVAAAIVVGFWALSLVAPRGEPVDDVSYALVQGGGPQRTRAADTDEREVFERHLRASEQITTPVDLVLWPENVVSVDELAGSREDVELAALARRLGTTLIVGVTEDAGRENFLNAAVVYNPDGTMGERYDKIRRVPFGEYVPLRGLLERVAGDAGLPRRDAIEGDGPALLRTEAGDLAVAISWEVFFTDRVREGVLEDAQIVINPTNGSSYWLTQVQTQQVASSRLRAIETGQWVLQSAPTGFTAVVTPDGDVLARSGVSEQRVFQGEAELRRGNTIAMATGPQPVVLIAAVALAGAWALQRRYPSGADEPSDAEAAVGPR
jgi:apolipoprotein N-acyltransferase